MKVMTYKDAYTLGKLFYNEKIYVNFCGSQTAVKKKLGELHWT